MQGDETNTSSCDKKTEKGKTNYNQEESCESPRKKPRNISSDEKDAHNLGDEASLLPQHVIYFEMFSFLKIVIFLIFVVVKFEGFSCYRYSTFTIY
jgi:hypothetical protein